jgi:hypothetical protein
MSKKEENDLFIFIEALKSHNYKGFKRSLLSSSKKNSGMKYALFEEISRGNLFNKSDFIKKKSLNEKQFSMLKFQLFQELLNFLKTNYDEFSDIALHNNVIEFELLLDKGLYYKAAKRLKKIKEIAVEKCDFNACCTVQIKAIEHKLYKYVYPKETREEASIMLREYQKLSDNLNEFKLLSSDVLHAHYTYMDRRADNSDEILEYLKHPLLKDKSQATSILSIYYYYKTKSSIYYGNNEYQKTKDYSLKAYHHLKQHPSMYRNDYLKSLICLNNYIDASFYLKETESYEIMYPQMIDIVKIASKTSDTHSNALIFQILSTLKLNYLWIKKDTVQFYKEIDSFVESYTKYEFVLRPNFKLELIINMANMYFLAGDLKMANDYCKRIDFEKSNPTSLFISCAHILRIMINFDLKNYQYLSHLVSTSKYLLNKRNRLFDLEHIFFKSFTQIKYHYTPKEHQHIFDKLFKELQVLIKIPDNRIISNKIGLLEWVQLKSSYANSKE